MSQLLDDLKAVRWLLNDRSSWTKNASARDKNSKEVPADHPRACRWCLGGAALYITYGTERKIYLNRLIPLLNTLREHLPWPISVIPEFNDNRATKHRDVLALLDTAIAQEESKCSTQSK
jgi:hypothetical protein